MNDMTQSITPNEDWHGQAAQTPQGLMDAELEAALARVSDSPLNKILRKHHELRSGTIK